jgi:cell division inhibitor SepF
LRAVAIDYGACAVSNIFGKLRDFVGFNQPSDYDFGDYDEMDSQGYQPNYSTASYSTDFDQTTSSREEPSSFHQPEPEVRSTSSPSPNAPVNNVIGMPNNGKWWGSVAEVMVMEPRAFEEMPQVIQALRERKSVVLNLTMMEPEQAQRAVDFIAGATFTIDGHQERIGESIFLFTPSCVQVSTQSGGSTQSTPVREVSQPSSASPRTPAPWTSDPVNSRIAL